MILSICLHILDSILILTNSSLTPQIRFLRLRNRQTKSSHVCGSMDLQRDRWTGSWPWHDDAMMHLDIAFYNQCSETFREILQTLKWFKDLSAFNSSICSILCCPLLPIYQHTGLGMPLCSQSMLLPLFKVQIPKLELYNPPKHLLLDKHPEIPQAVKVAASPSSSTHNPATLTSGSAWATSAAVLFSCSLVLLALVRG